MEWSKCEAGSINAATQRFWVALGKRADRVVRLLVLDEDFADRLADFALEYGFTPSPEYLQAKEVMGNNFFGVEDMFRELGVCPTTEEINFLNTIPYTLKTLAACKDTHVLVAVLGKGLFELKRSILNYETFVILPETTNLSVIRTEYSAIADKHETRWVLIRAEPLSSSTGMSWPAQQEFPKRDEEVVSSHTLLYTIQAFALKRRSEYDLTKRFLFVNRGLTKNDPRLPRIRCSDYLKGSLDKPNTPVVIAWERKGSILYIAPDAWKGSADDGTGIVIAKTPDKG